MLARRVLFLVCVFCLALYAPLSEANSNGKTSPSCGCHGGSSSSTTVSLSGQPSSYAPGQSYTFTVSVSNSQISNSLGGFSLDASSGTFSNPGSNAKLDSGKVTHSNRNARSWTVDWTAPPSGTGTVTVDIAGLAANGASGNNGDSWNTATYNIPEQPPQNQAPSVSNVIISPSSPTTTDSLSVSYSYSDSDGDLESGTTIQWSRDSSIITSLDDSSSVPSSFISKDETWTVTVTPSDGIDFGSPVSSPPIIVQNTPPVVNYDLNLLYKICKLNSFVAIKEDVKNHDFTIKVLNKIKNHCTVIRSGGGMESFLKYHKHGCQAWLVGIECIDPKIAFDFYKAMINKDYSFCKSVIKNIERPFFKLVAKYGWHLTIKSCLKNVNLMESTERMPLKKLNSKAEQKIFKFMDRIRNYSEKKLKKDYFLKVR